MISLFKNLISSGSINKDSTLIVSLGLLFIFCFLLIIGRRFKTVLKLERLGIPISLLIGGCVLLIGPYGPKPFFPESVIDLWISLPTPLLTLVFATLMIGRPIPKGNSLLKPIASQTLLGLFLGIGQYLVGGIIVLMLLIPYLNVDPLMGCLIEVGFEGGHGAASVMGESFKKIGFESGLDLGLAMATVGLLSSTLIGTLLIIIGRFMGWITYIEDNIEDKEYLENSIGIFSQLSQIAVNLALAGIAVLLGIFLLSGLHLIGEFLGGTFQEVLSIFPVFPLALIGSFLLRFLLEKFNRTELVSELLQREIGIISTDLLITTAIAGLNLPLLLKDWLPLTILACSGLVWNLFGIFFFSKIALNEKWFERSIVEFGNATGVAASGLLLLRLADPRDETNTLPIFSIKQLFLQPLLSGGIITVVAPIAVRSFGLQGWTELCGALTILFVLIAVFLQGEVVFKD